MLFPLTNPVALRPNRAAPRSYPQIIHNRENPKGLSCPSLEKTSNGDPSGLAKNVHLCNSWIIPRPACQ